MKKIYSPKEFSRLIKKSYSTLKLWDKKGILVANRTPSNRRFYTEDQCKAFIGNTSVNQESDTRKVAGTRIKKELYDKIKTAAEREDKNISSYIEEVLEDHFEIKKNRGYKVMMEKLSTVIPDLNEQGRYYLALKRSLDGYTDQNQKLHDYIAEQKSAESYYFREIREMLNKKNTPETSPPDYFNKLAELNKMMIQLVASSFIKSVKEGSKTEALIKKINKDWDLDIPLRRKQEAEVKWLKDTVKESHAPD